VAVLCGSTQLFTFFVLSETGFLPHFSYKIALFIPAILAARGYWDISDDGIFSVPLYFLQIGLIWALYYLLTVDPPLTTFSLIYNRFADLAFFFIIGCSIYRIRALKRKAYQDEMLKGIDRIKGERVVSS